ncbi:MAG: zinc ribbon domain-containing protein [Nitrospirae bacterium]|nr:zinc ribbon domain-containing protein [Nitrospirota bacterium]
MPIYEYDCLDCKKTFSILKGINDNSDTLCISCESINVKKKISAFSCCGTDGGADFGSMPSKGHG